MPSQSHFARVVQLLDDVSLIRPQDNQNVDLLISKPNLYTYINKEKINLIESLGIPTTALIDSKYPELRDYFINLRNETPQYKNCVLAFFCRVPETIPNSQRFLEQYTPIRILLSRIKRAKEDFKILTCNFPNNIHKLGEDEIHQLCQKEKDFYRHFASSKHPYFLDIPMAAIECKQGFLPGFACKILEDDK